MSRKQETRLQRSIQRRIKREFPTSRWFKVWGGPFQEAGISDLLGCVEGLYCALEVKLPGSDYEKPTELQINFLEDIRKAKGLASVVTSPEEATQAIQIGLESTRPLPKILYPPDIEQTYLRTIRRARNRKDLDDRRGHRAHRR